MRLTPAALSMLLVCLALVQASCASVPRAPDLERVRTEVAAAERAFARTMADRNLNAFAAHVAEEAVFFSGAKPLRGRAEVLAWWSQYFVTPGAPFSWEPDEVEPLRSGTLAFSSGPVRSPDGTVVARFNSVWRLERDGKWRVIFDKGSPLPPSPRE